MAIYDLTSSTPSSLAVGDIINCPYSGAQKSITLPAGTYQLQVWGAQGGSYSSYYGGVGGYSIGTLVLTADSTTVYLYAGGQPATNTSTSSGNTSPGGFNGGGTAVGHVYSGTYSYAQGGGGGSDIRIGTDSLYARVIVAGGGSGSSSYDMTTYGYGGGTTSGGYSGYTASQTSAGSGGSFGQGCNSTGSYIYKYGSPGGGGGWYGGGANTKVSDTDSSLRQQAGGGSGYVYTSSTASNYPSGCLLNSVYYLTDAATYAGNTSFISTGGSNETGHSGNGYCRITVLALPTSFAMNVNIGGTWKEVDTAYVNISGAWKEVEGIYTNIGGSWKESG